MIVSRVASESIRNTNKTEDSNNRRREMLVLGDGETMGVVYEMEKIGEGDQGEGLVSGEKIPNQGGPTLLVLKEIGLGLGLGYFFVPSKCAKLPPFACLWRPVFIGKNIAKFPNLIPQLLSFIVNLIFLIFLDFSYQH